MKVHHDQVLRYMASNGLVANAKKTAFLILNGKQVNTDLCVSIGGESVKRESSACLLGIKFQDNLQWKDQIQSKGGLVSALNSRLYIIRRLRSHLNKKSILKLVDGIFMSKLRYGLQLYGKVRMETSDQECAELKGIQLIQNNLLRSLNGSKIKDMVFISSLLTKFNMSSVNQINCQIKLLEVWKALNMPNYPLLIDCQVTNDTRVSTRADTNNKPLAIGKSILTQKTCISDAIRLWNFAPDYVVKSKSVTVAKTAIKKYARQLPI